MKKKVYDLIKNDLIKNRSSIEFVRFRFLFNNRNSHVNCCALNNAHCTFYTRNTIMIYTLVTFCCCCCCAVVCTMCVYLPLIFVIAN